MSSNNYAHKQYAGLQPIDFVRPQKRIYRNIFKNETKRVLNPQLLDNPQYLHRTLSEVRFRNNGTWNSLMERTKKEDSLIGKFHRSNPRLFSSDVFTKPIIKKENNQNNTFNNNKNYNNNNYNNNNSYNNNNNYNNISHKNYNYNFKFNNNNNERLHCKITPYSDYSKTTAIYSLPGCIKRCDLLIKDDKKNYNKRINYATLYKNCKDYGPIEMKKDNINENKSIFSGGYGYKYKNKSTIFDNNPIENNRNKGNKKRLNNICNTDHVHLC